MVVIDRWSLYRNSVNNDNLIKWSLCTVFLKKSACQIWHEHYLGQNQPFTKFVEATNNLAKLVEVGRHLAKLVKFSNNFMKFIEFAKNFIKLVEFARNFPKFVGLTNNFHEVHRSCKQLNKAHGTHQWLLESHKTRKNLMKFVDWKVRFKSLKVFLYLNFTCLNI